MNKTKMVKGWQSKTERVVSGLDCQLQVLKSVLDAVEESYLSGGGLDRAQEDLCIGFYQVWLGWKSLNRARRELEEYALRVAGEAK